MQYFLCYLFIINAAGFLSMLVDKHRAKKNHWRISERTLFSIALLGGSAGSLLGMQLARHKTRHPKFSLGIPLILAVQLVIFTWIVIFSS